MLMKTIQTPIQCLLTALAVLASVNPAAAQGTAFTYQGQLESTGGPANGNYDFLFILYAASIGGSQTGPIVTNLAVPVRNGLFVATLDFGSGIFAGASYWLDISVRTNGNGSFSELSPRQSLTPTPYAIYAESARAAGGGSFSLNNDPLLVNGGSDPYDGLVYMNGLPFVPFGEGPFVFGLTGGALGTLNPTEVNLAWDYSGNVWVSNMLFATSLNVDRAGMNNGNINSSTNALTFGIGSGEGIASKRTAGYNQHGLDFYTSFQERLSIVNSGLVGINTTNPSENLEINGTARLDDNDVYFRAGSDRNHGLGYRQYVQTGPATNTVLVDGPFLYGFNGGGLGISGPDIMMLQWNYLGEVDVYSNLVVHNSASKPGGGSWTALSDARLKKDVKPLEGALDKMLALRGVTYEFKEPEKIHELSGQRMGMIAQEVEEVFPDWVETGADGYKRLTVRGFEALTVEAVRQLRAESSRKIADLQKQLADQKALNERNDARFAVLEQMLQRLTNKPSDSIAMSEPRP